MLKTFFQEHVGCRVISPHHSGLQGTALHVGLESPKRLLSHSFSGSPQAGSSASSPLGPVEYLQTDYAPAPSPSPASKS